MIGQGDIALQSDLARQKFAVDGTGITIGVVSDSYNALADPANLGTTGAGLDQASCDPFFVNDCDLPRGINVLADDPFGTDEGRAMLQILHDVAPGADLAFSTAGNSEVQMAEAIRRLRDAGSDVIVDDIGFITEPFFEDGIISRAVDEVANDGVVYTSAAGNEGTNSYESEFVDSGIPGLLGTTLHDFNPGNGVDPFMRVAVPFNTVLTMTLQWDQPFASLHAGASSASDVDIFLYGLDQQTRLASAATNNVGGDPLETLFFFNNAVRDLDSDGFIDEEFYLSIGHASGPAPDLLKIVSFGTATFEEFQTDSSTSWGHPNAEGAISVAASAYFLTPQYGVNPPIVNDFSSLGGMPILFDAGGNRLSTPDVRLKPDVTGPDHVNTTFFGVDVVEDLDSIGGMAELPNFPGTSAAAPHIAGVAALMLENAGGPGSLSPNQVAAVLRATAIDITERMNPNLLQNVLGFSLPTEDIIDGAGFDFFSGFGFVDAAAAVAGTDGLELGPGSISGIKWNDGDGDGIRDTGEQGLAGWTIYVDVNGNNTPDIAEPQVVTGALGQYTLANLPPGTHVVKEVPQAGWMQTFPSDGVHRVQLDFGEQTTGINFGNRQLFSTLVGSVFDDVNENGVRDAGEVGIPGVIIRFDDDGDGVISISDRAVTTDSNGSYLIQGLSGGQLLVRLTPRAGWIPTGSSQTVVDLGAGETLFGVDFGLRHDFVEPGDPDPDPNPDPGGGSTDDPTHGFVEGFQLGESFGVDDGVVFVSGLEPGSTRQVIVIASQLAVSRGFLHAWIDFNGDGDLTDAGEQVLRNVRLDNGVNLVSMDIPAGATATDVLARFRWGFELNETPTGPAIGGEIEDYFVTIPMAADARLVAGDDVFTVTEDSTNNMLDVLANDSVGPLGGTPTIEAVTAAQNGVVTIENERLVYTPNPNFFGVDVFEYVLGDGLDHFTMATVTIAVTPTNDPPTANDDVFAVVSESLSISLDVLANDTIAPDAGETLTIIEFSSPSRGGQLSAGQNGRSLIYTPDAGFLGTETFTYTISDGNGGTDTANVSVAVTPAPPQVRFDLGILDRNNQSTSTVNVGEEFFLTVSASDLRDQPEGIFSAYLDVFYDDATLVSVDGSIQFAAVFANGQSGNATVPGLINEAGAVSSLATAPVSGEVFRVPFIAESIGMVSFLGDPSDILPANEVSLIGRNEAVPDSLIEFGGVSLSIVGAVADAFTVNEDSQANVLDVLANDAAVPNATLTITDVTATEQGGEVMIVGGATLRYAPPDDFFGEDSFDYTMQDSSGRMSSASVTITVNPINDNPTANDDLFEIAPNSLNVALDVLSNDTIAPDINETLRVTGTGPTSNGGTVLISGDGGSLIYTPAVGFDGVDTFTYTVSDGNGGTDQANVTVEVKAFVGYRLEITDTSGNAISSTRVSEPFVLNVYVEDLREEPLGVFSAYLDVLYAANLVAPTGLPDFTESVYRAGQSGNIDTPGVVDEAGATDGNTPLGGGEFLLFTIPFIAENAGIATFEADFPDNLPLHQITLYETEEAVDEELIRFGTASIEVQLEGAVGDDYEVSEDSQANILDVLANDIVLPTQEPLTIISAGPGSQGGSIGIVNGTTLSYTPAPNFNGTETFVYTIEDNLGETTQATVRVVVTPTNDNPTVQNDAFSVTIDSIDNELDVLANDSIAPDMDEVLSISGVGTPNQGGSVEISAGGQSLIYTPPAGFEGQETFTYTASDGNGGTAQGLVTVSVEPEVIEPIASFILVFADTSEIPVPIDTVNVGEEFQLQVFVQDIRPVPQGVFSAYMDIVYAGAGAAVNGPIDFNNAVYPGGHSGDTTVAGIINELGGVDGTSPLGNGDPVLLATIPMIAGSGGTVTATADPADLVPPNGPNETTVFGLLRTLIPEEIVFGTDTLTVTSAAAAAPFRNAANQYDVNNDKVVSPLDALLVIDALNTPGGRSLSRVTNGAANSGPTYYVDVNGDNVVSPLDALLVIGQIGNSPAAGPVAAPLSGRAEFVTPSPADENAEQDLAAPPAELLKTAMSSAHLNVWTSPSFAEVAKQVADGIRTADFSRQLSDHVIESSSTAAAAVDDLEGILDDVAEEIMEAWQAR